jgi:hypothetical protein
MKFINFGLNSLLICNLSLLTFMSLSSVEQGQSERASLLPKQDAEPNHSISRKKGLLLLGLAATLGLGSYLAYNGE